MSPLAMPMSAELQEFLNQIDQTAVPIEQLSEREQAMVRRWIAEMPEYVLRQATQMRLHGLEGYSAAQLAESARVGWVRGVFETRHDAPMSFAAMALIATSHRQCWFLELSELEGSA